MPIKDGMSLAGILKVPTMILEGGAVGKVG
jgi:hypothetical protein